MHNYLVLVLLGLIFILFGAVSIISSLVAAHGLYTTRNRARRLRDAILEVAHKQSNIEERERRIDREVLDAHNRRQREKANNQERPDGGAPAQQQDEDPRAVWICPITRKHCGVCIGEENCQREAVS